MTALTANQQRVQNYLMAGISPARISELTGVSASYITELLQSSDFLQHAKDAQAEEYLVAKARDTKVDTIEDTLIGKVESLVNNPISFLGKPLEAIRALQMVNSLKRRTASFSGLDDQNGIAQTVVKLTMPVAIINNFTINQESVKVDSKGNIIEVEDTPFVTIQHNELENLLEKQSCKSINLNNISNISNLNSLPMEAFI